jgi:hypothetical protein
MNVKYETTPQKKKIQALITPFKCIHAEIVWVFVHKSLDNDIQIFLTFNDTNCSISRTIYICMDGWKDVRVTITVEDGCN